MNKTNKAFTGALSVTFLLLLSSCLQVAPIAQSIESIPLAENMIIVKDAVPPFGYVSYAGGISKVSPIDSTIIDLKSTNLKIDPTKITLVPHTTVEGGNFVFLTPNTEQPILVPIKKGCLGMARIGTYIYANCGNYIVGMHYLGNDKKIYAVTSTTGIVNFPNGMAADEKNHLYLTESGPLKAYSRIYRFEISPTDQYKIIPENTKLWAHIPGIAASNGIKVFGDEVYYTYNITALIGSLTKFGIDINGNATQPTLLYSSINFLDDIYIDDNHYFLSKYFANQIVIINSTTRAVDKIIPTTGNPSSVHHAFDNTFVYTDRSNGSIQSFQFP